MLNRLVIVPILVGGIVYLTWRSPRLLMFAWMEHLGLASFVLELRVLGAPLSPFVPDIVRFSLPDAAWAYAATSWLTYLWRWQQHPLRWIFITFGPVAVLGGELGQLVGLVPGTFDVHDLWLSAIGAALGAAHAYELYVTREVLRFVRSLPRRSTPKQSV